MFSCYTVFARLLIASIALAVIGPGTLPTPTAAQSPESEIDLPAMTIRPTDLDQPGWLHQGAYVHAVSDQARDQADYIGRGTDAEEIEERLTAVGWQREYVSYLSLPSKADPTKPQQVIRSYVTEYADADGAAAGFSYLEDESLVATASDIPLDREYGEQSELTSERGIGGLDGRQFRSVDLTFRSGRLVAGVTLIQYPTASRVDPDIDQAESLATIMETRVTADLPVITSVLGAEIVRLEHEQREVVTFDDAYYRIAGIDIPLEGESQDSAASRAETYANAVDVYQLWQGVDTARPTGVLYGVTMLHFPDESAAGTWLTNLPEILASNPFYGDIQPESADLGLGDQTVALSYAAGGGSGTDPHAQIIAVRVGTDVARVHLVPQGNLESVPRDALVELATAQVACLIAAHCDPVVSVPGSLIDSLSPATNATPASPVTDTQQTDTSFVGPAGAWPGQLSPAASDNV